MSEEIIHILFVQNLPKRGITAVEAFKPDPTTSQVHVVRELDAIQFLQGEGPYAAYPPPTLIVLDIEMDKSIEKTVRKQLKRSGRADIPVVMLSHKDEDDTAARGRRVLCPV